MLVGDICSRDVIIARPTEWLRAAAELMARHNVGSVVVCNEIDGREVPTGIVTDRDVMLSALRNEQLDHTLISQVMSSNLLLINQDEDIDDAAERMRSRTYRRAPVVDADGGLVGIISIDDLIEVIACTLNSVVRLVQRQTRPGMPAV